MMSKLILGLAALTAGSVMAIESSNIVGYQTHDLTSGQKDLRGINFYAITGDGVDIQAITPKDGDAISSDDFKTWWWNSNKDKNNSTIGNEYAVRRAYYWNPEDPNNEDGYVFLDDEDPSVWIWTTMDDDMPIKWVKTFNDGTGLFCQPGGETPSLTVAGQVLKPVDNVAYYPIQLSSGTKVLIASPFPVAVKLADIVPFDGDDVSSDDFKTWWWNSNKIGGSTIGNEYAVRRAYYWDPEDPNNEDGYVFLDDEDPSVWVWTSMDDDMPIVWDKEFASGEGFFTQPGGEDPKILFPNPFYVAE